VVGTAGERPVAKRKGLGSLCKASASTPALSIAEWPVWPSRVAKWPVVEWAIVEWAIAGLSMAEWPVAVAFCFCQL